ncbi:hypothetical protein K438DRAFT_1945847 [Mycena galopus ATCC 62051]|nr:hypothetical protein K438DRAFT_1945847 [Mycena galopus ATCC 62051]
MSTATKIITNSKSLQQDNEVGKMALSRYYEQLLKGRERAGDEWAGGVQDLVVLQDKWLVHQLHVKARVEHFEDEEVGDLGGWVLVVEWPECRSDSDGGEGQGKARQHRTDPSYNGMGERCGGNGCTNAMGRKGKTHKVSPPCVVIPMHSSSVVSIDSLRTEEGKKKPAARMGKRAVRSRWLMDARERHVRELHHGAAFARGYLAFLASPSFLSPREEESVA